MQAGESVSFTVDASDPDGNLHTAEWYIDGKHQENTDGLSGSSSTESWTHTFESPGTYEVAAEVFDDKWLSNDNGAYWTVDVCTPEISTSPSQTDLGTFSYDDRPTVQIEVENTGCGDLNWVVNSHPGFDIEATGSDYVLVKPSDGVYGDFDSHVEVVATNDQVSGDGFARTQISGTAKLEASQPTAEYIDPSGVGASIGHDITLRGGAYPGEDGIPEDDFPAADADELVFIWEIDGTEVARSTTDGSGGVPAVDEIDYEFEEAGDHTVSLTVRDPETGKTDTISEGGYTVREAIVKGSVTAAHSNEPIEDVQVTLDGDSTHTDSNGEFSFSIDEAGDYTLSFSKDRYRPATKEITVDSPGGGEVTQDVELSARPTEVSFEVSKKSTIEGYEFSGEPIENAEITVNGNTKRTNGDGTVSFELTPGEYEFTAAADGFESLTNVVEVPVGGTKTVSVPLVRTDAGVLDLNVVDSDGNAIAANKYRVFADGERLDINVNGEAILDTGVYTLTVEPTDPESGDLETVEKTVSINEGKRKVVEFDLSNIARTESIQYNDTTYEIIWRRDNKIEIRDAEGELITADTTKDVLAYYQFQRYSHESPEFYQSKIEEFHEYTGEFRLDNPHFVYWGSHLNEAGMEAWRIIARLYYGDYAGAATELIGLVEHATRVMDEQMNNPYEESLHNLVSKTQFASEMVYEKPSQVKDYINFLQKAQNLKEADSAGTWMDAVRMAETTESGDIDPNVAGLAIDAAQFVQEDAESGLKITSKQQLATLTHSRVQQGSLLELKRLSREREQGTINRTEMYAYFITQQRYYTANAWMSNRLYNLEQLGKQKSVLFSLQRSFIMPLLTDESISQQAIESKDFSQSQVGDSYKRMVSFYETYDEMTNHTINIYGDSAEGSELTLNKPLGVRSPDIVQPGETVVVEVTFENIPVENAQVNPETRATELTNDAGEVAISFDSTGSKTITVDKEGYESTTVQVQVNFGRLLSKDQPAGFNIGSVGGTDRPIEQQTTIKNPTSDNLALSGAMASHKGVSARLSKTMISPGESLIITATVDPSEFSNNIINESIVLDWTTPDARTKLPITGVVKDTEKPTISTVSLNNDGDDNLQLSFQSAEQLQTISVSIDSPSTTDIYTFDRSDFSESGDGPYTYTLTTTQAFDAGEGIYTATVDDATDSAGNNGGVNGQGSDLSDSYTLDKTPPSISSPLLIDGTDDNGVVKEGDSITISVTVTDPSRIDSVVVDASAFGAGNNVPLTDNDNDDTYDTTITVGSSATDGDQSVTITATDTEGNSNTETTETLTVDTTAPSITDMSGPNDGEYTPGETLTFDISYDEAIQFDTSSGTPSIGIIIGGDTKQADLASGDGTRTLTFTYTIQSGDTDRDGVEFASNTVNLNGSRLTDLASNDATQDFSRQAPDLTDVTISTSSSKPTFTSVSKVDSTHIEFTITDETDVDESSITASDFTLNTGAIASISVSESGTDATVTLTLERAVDADTIDVSIVGSIADTDENLLTSGTRTVSGMDGVAPKLEGASKVDDTTIDLTLSDGGSGLDKSSITASDFTLSTGRISNIDTSEVTDGATGAQTVTITLASSIDTDTVTISLQSGAGGVQDGAENSQTSGSASVSGMDGVAPTITSFEVTNSSGSTLNIQFDSSEHLSTIEIEITDSSGAVVKTLSRSNFTESDSTTYTWSKTMEEGTYTAILKTAKDTDDNDGASGESDTTAISTGGDTTPLIDGFEDGDISEYSGDTGGFELQQSVVKNGEWSLKGQVQSGNNQDIHRSVNLAQPSQVQASVRVGHGGGNENARVSYRATGSDSSRVIDIDFAMNHGASGFGDMSGEPVLLVNGKEVMDIKYKRWYLVELEQIDWSSEIIGTVVVNGSIEKTNVEFRTSASSVDSLSLRVGDWGSEPAWFDDVTVGSPDEMAPKITTFELTNPSGQTVNVTVETDEQLSALTVSGVDDASGTTLSGIGSSGDFIESGSGPYTYTATLSTGSDGTFGGTLDTAADAAGNDGADGQSDTVTLEPDNAPPVAQLSANKTKLIAGHSVQLNASSSHDVDNASNELTYTWQRINAPTGADPDPPIHAVGTVTLSEPGTYEFEVTVSDGLTSDSTTITIIVDRNQRLSFEEGSLGDPNPPPPWTLRNGENKISGDNTHEVSDDHASHGETSIHLASYEHSTSIEVGVEVNLTTVDTVLYDAYLKNNSDPATTVTIDEFGVNPARPILEQGAAVKFRNTKTIPVYILFRDEENVRIRNLTVPANGEATNFVREVAYYDVYNANTHDEITGGSFGVNEYGQPWGKIKINVNNTVVSDALVNASLSEDRWYYDIEANVSEFTGRHTLSFWVNGNSADAYFDNFRFLDPGRETIPPSDVVAEPKNNQPPIAQLSANKTEATPGNSVLLSASDSHDPDNASSDLTYEWVLVDAPSDTSPNLPTGSSGTITLREAGTYRFNVTVSDGLDSDNATVRIEVHQVNVSLTGSATLSPPDKNVTVGYTVQNNRSSSAGFILNITRLPEGFSITNRSDDGGTWSTEGRKRLFKTIKADGSKSPAITLRVSDGTTGNYTVAANILDNQRVLDSVTVEFMCLSINSAVDTNNDGEIGDLEILQAIEYWRTDGEVPETCGKTIADFEILKLIEKWRTGAVIDAPADDDPGTEAAQSNISVQDDSDSLAANNRQTLSVSASSVTPGNATTISFNLTNTGSAPQGSILAVRIPDGFTATDRTDAGGTWKADETKWLWQTIDPNETKSPDVTVAIPENASGEYSVKWSIKTADGVATTAATTITVDNGTSQTCINHAVAGDNGVLGLSEIQTAINWWAENVTVPDTGGEAIGLSEIQNLINAWENNTVVSCSG